jgi:uncharacterized protein
VFELSYGILVIFLAAIVRGYSGFGFSLLTITALSLVYPTAEIVPAIFMLEIVASLHLLPSIWRDVHWKSLLPLIVGCLIATPLGVWALASLPPAPMQLAMSIFVLAAVALMAKGYAMKTMPNLATSTVAGAASGLANGAFGIGGPPVVLFYFSSPAGHIAGRASLTVFFIATDVIGLANLSVHGLITKATLIQSLIFLPPLFAGVWLGARSFKGADPEQFRKVVLVLLAFLAVVIGAKSTVLLWT